MHRIWRAMLTRCYNPNSDSYPRYGGRGIGVCPEWRKSFDAFYAALGEPPTPKHQLDRYPDADGDYEPGNVRWATAKENAWSKIKYHGNPWEPEGLPKIVGQRHMYKTIKQAHRDRALAYA